MAGSMLESRTLDSQSSVLYNKLQMNDCMKFVMRRAGENMTCNNLYLCGYMSRISMESLFLKGVLYSLTRHTFIQQTNFYCVSTVPGTVLEDKKDRQKPCILMQKHR